MLNSRIFKDNYIKKYCVENDLIIIEINISSMNPQFDNNKLLSGYQNFQQNNVPFQNNVLLQNNPMFTGNMQYANSMQMQQMYQMQQMQQMQMQKLKELQQIKHIEKMNEIETTMDKEKIKESVIKPIRIERTRKDKQELENKWKDVEKNYTDKSGKDFGPEIKQYWKMRTNEPYKNILKKEDYSKKIATKDDLIVHRVTDKDKEGVQEDFSKMDNNREKHNNELKVIYSTNHKNEHKKKFEYNHVYKYRIQYDPGDHDKLKQDKIKYYKQQQKKEEDGKQKIDSILDLISDGIFDKDELSSINITKNINIDNDSSGSINSTGNVTKNNTNTSNNTSKSNINTSNNINNTSNTRNTGTKKDIYLNRKQQK